MGISAEILGCFPDGSPGELPGWIPDEIHEGTSSGILRGIPGGFICGFSVGILRENPSRTVKGIPHGFTERILGDIPEGIPYLNSRRNSC